MDSVNKKILELLALGLTQQDISEYLKKKGITPNSVSIIEKRLRKIKKEYNAKTLFHLALILKKKQLFKNNNMKNLIVLGKKNGKVFPVLVDGQNNMAIFSNIDEIPSEVCDMSDDVFVIDIESNEIEIL